MALAPNGLDYGPLITLWGTLPAASNGAQILINLATINSKTVAGPKQDVQVSSVVKYLALTGKLQPLRRFASASPTPAGSTQQAQDVASSMLTVIDLPDIQSFQMSDPVEYAAVQGMLGALSSDPNSGITPTDTAALLNLAATEIPWITAPLSAGLGLHASYTSVGVHDLIEAGIITEDFAKAQEIF